MVARNRMTAFAVGLSAILLAQPAAAGEAAQVQKVPAAAELVVEAQVFRTAIDTYIREQDRELREALNESLRRELTEKIVLSTNELRTRT